MTRQLGLVVGLAVGSAAHAAPEGDALHAILEDELARALQVWTAPEDRPHYVAIALEDRTSTQVSARRGALDRRDDDRARYLDVDLRLGTPELDSTHPLRGFSAFDGERRRRVAVPFEGPRAEVALRHALWGELDTRWADARERLVLLRTSQQVRVEEEHPAPDFAPRAPVVARREVPPLRVDAHAWADVLAEVSAVLDASPVVVDEAARLDAVRQVFTFVDTEGTRLRHGRTHARVALSATVIADDGDQVGVFRAVDVHEPSRLPQRDALLRLAREVVAEAEALRAAPRAAPYTGPVLLSGRSAAVFFHEVLGHRVEGHRNKSEDEGKTFLDHVGRRVLPPFLDVWDDPTVPRLHGVDLNGHYAFDDEGVPAARALLVRDGVFQGFLLGRSPLQGFPASNGHGRRSAGNPPTARMANTVVEASRAVGAEHLRRMLLDEIRAQGLAFGYVVEEIDGGFTLTGRTLPNAFNVRASRTVRVWADGRPDELVRGVDLVGTPLVAFRSILAAGDTPEVFNGTCGAESGWVPVSAVAPALLFRRLEFQLKEKASERPPLLPKPSAARDDASVEGAP